MPLGNGARPCIALWLLLQLTAALAAAPPPLAIPNIPFTQPGSVLAIAQQADGSLILGGDFTLIDGVPRAHLARLTPAGTLDANWNPSADGIVRALATDAYGNVFAGGDFAAVGGQPHRLVAKIAGSGQGIVDDAWDPGFVDDGTSLSFDVLTLALDANGDVFAGGDFHEVGGLHRDFVAKLSGLGEGAVDPDWNPGVETSVHSLAIDPSGWIYTAQSPPQTSGCGDLICDCDVICIGKFSTDGDGLPAADWTAPSSPSGAPAALTIASDGTLYAAGGFSNGASVVRFLPSGHGAIDAAWTPPALGYATALALDGDHTLYVGGDSISKLSTAASGAVVVAWTASATPAFSALAVTSGNVYVGGPFTLSYFQSTDFGLLRLSTADGSRNPTVEVESPGMVQAIAFQHDGGTIVGGRFLRAGTAHRNRLARIAADGSLDVDWNPALPIQTYTVYALAIGADDSVYAGVPSANYLGDPVNFPASALFKFSGSSTGEFDPNWRNPIAQGLVYALTLDEDTGVLYAGGVFSTVDGAQRPNIAKLSTDDGAVDLAFDADIEYGVNIIALDGSGNLYAGGEWETTGLLERPTLTKLSAASGAADTTWQPAMPPGQTWSLAMAPDGALYVGGTFYPEDPYNNPPVRYLVKIASDGTIDSGFNPPQNTDAVSRYVYSLVLAADGSIYAGGTLTTDRFSGFMTHFSGIDGSIVPDWDPIPDGDIVLALALHDGNLYIGGNFATVSALPRGGLAALPLATSPPPPMPPGHSHHARPLAPTEPSPESGAVDVRPALRRGETSESIRGIFGALDLH